MRLTYCSPIHVWYMFSGCPKVIFKYDDFNLTGAPSSIDKDTDGNLWIGSFGGGQVRFYIRFTIILFNDLFLY